MIYVEGLTKYYGSFCAVDNISFEIKKGEILGLLGPNGAGKTTTLRMLTCYLSPNSGTAKIKNFNVLDNSLEIKEMIGYLPESAPIYQDMLVYDYLDYVADLRNIEKSKKENRIKELAEMCGLNSVMHKSVNELSKGYKQRVGLAHAIMSDPEILVLDEPTSGLDPNQIIEIRELIKRLGKEKTVILSSHILSEVEATCDRVVIINKGKIAADDSIEELKKSASGRYQVKLTLQNADFPDVENELKKLSGISQVQKQESTGPALNINLVCDSADDLRPVIYNSIKKKDWVMLEFGKENRSLENIFRELTLEENPLAKQ